MRGMRLGERPEVRLRGEMDGHAQAALRTSSRHDRPVPAASRPRAARGRRRRTGAPRSSPPAGIGSWTWSMPTTSISSGGSEFDWLRGLRGLRRLRALGAGRRARDPAVAAFQASMSIPAHGSKSHLERLLGRPVRLGHVDEVHPDAIPDRGPAAHPVDQDVRRLEVRRRPRDGAPSSARGPRAPAP